MLTRRRLSCAALILLGLLIPASRVLAQNENETVGFQTDHIFESGAFGESIDVLNGGLNLTIPIGPRYQVNSRLGYQLRLSYNSRIWDSSEFGNLFVALADRIMPYNEGPGGLGFSLHLGRVFIESKSMYGCGGKGPARYNCMYRSYRWVGPDGTQHDFYYDDKVLVQHRNVEEELGATITETTDPLDDYPVFTSRKTTDNTQILIVGPADKYCYPASEVGKGGCYQVRTPDGLIYTLAKRVDCADPGSLAGAPDAAYPLKRSEQQSYCGWYTTLIEDSSAGARSPADTTTGPVTTPYPNHVTVTYDDRPGFEHVMRSITDSAGRSIVLSTCEHDPGTSACIDPEPIYGGSVRADRHRVAITRIEIPAVAAGRATYGFDYRLQNIDRANPDNPSQNNFPILLLERIDYPSYQRVSGQAGTSYSLYFDYNRYGELDCRTLPVETISGGYRCGATTTEKVADFRYTYNDYEYMSLFVSGGFRPTCTPTSKCGGGIGGGIANPTGVSRQIVEKKLELQPGVASGTWTYERGNAGTFTNPTKVAVTDPFGNATVYRYNASLPAPATESIDGSDPDDGYAPEWDDGKPYRVDYYQGSETMGVLVRSEMTEFDSDKVITRDGRRSKSNLREKSHRTQFLDDGGSEMAVSRSDWDGTSGHWKTEVESSSGLRSARTTRTEYVDGMIGQVYETGRILKREVSDGTKVLSRSDYDYDSATGKLKLTLDRGVPPQPGSPWNTQQRKGNVKTTYAYYATSGNLMEKDLSSASGTTDYAIKYTWAPSSGACTVPEDCGGYLAGKIFLFGPAGAPASWKAIDRDRDANTGLITATRDTAGVRTDYEYDSLGRVVRVTPAGEEATEIDYVSLRETTVARGTRGVSDLDPAADLVFSRYLYDTLGRLVATQKRPAEPNSNVGFACQKTQYDVGGRPVFKTEWAFRQADKCTGAIDRDVDKGTTYDYRDPASGAYDAFGRVRLEIPADANATTGEKVVETEYFGNSSQVTVHGLRGPDGGAFNSVHYYRKDTLNRLVEVIEPSAWRCEVTPRSCSETQVCPQGEMCVRDAADAQYEYDAADRLETVTLTDHLAKTQVRRFAYDGLGRLLWSENPENGTTVSGPYDALGNVRETRDAAGNLLKFVYDFAGRQTSQWIAPAGGSAEIEVATNLYDETGHGQFAAGKLTTSVSRDESGSVLLTESRFYDGIGGRLSQTLHNFSPNWPPSSAMYTDYAYTARGEIQSIKYPREAVPGRSVLTVSYLNKNGTVNLARESETPPGGQPTWVQDLGALSYNAAGSLQTIVTPGGGRTGITFDDRNRPASITGGAYDPVAQKWTYESGQFSYDGAGNIYAIGSNGYGYDASSRLVSAHTVLDSAATVHDERFSYDIFGNMAQRSLITTGSVTSEETDSFTLEAPETPVTNRILQRTTTLGTTGSTAVTYEYDARGNLVSGGKRSTVEEDIKKFHYGILNRLLAVQQVGDPATGMALSEVDRFAYDSGGNRLWRVEKGTGLVTFSVRDAGGQVLSEFRSAALPTSAPEWSADYIYVAGRLLSMKQNLKPRPPVNLRATQVPSGSGWLVTLTWDQNPEPDKAYYKIYRYVPGGKTTSYSLIGQISATSAAYADTTVHTTGTVVYYKISCVNQTGQESDASPILVLVKGDQTAPSAPSLTAAPGDGKVFLSWNSSTDASKIIGYELSRRTDTNGPIVPLTTQLVGGTTYTDLNLMNGTTYYYLVRARDALGNWSAYSCRPNAPPCDTAATPVDLTPPSPPKGVRATVSCGDAGGPETVVVSWEAHSAAEGVVSYSVHSNTEPEFGGLAPIATISATVYPETQTLTPGTTYYYAVTATDAAGNQSLFSKIVPVATRDGSISPQFTLTATAGDGWATIRWAKTWNDPSASKYLVYRRPNAASSCTEYVQVGQLQPIFSQNEYTDRSMANNQAYDYAVSQVVSCGTNCTKESTLSRPILAIPLSRPSSLYQCRRKNPWSPTLDGTLVQWTPPDDATIYQPYLANTANGVLGYLKGYHLYHHKLCGIEFVYACAEPGGICYEFYDNSPIRQVVFNASDPVDPYLLSRSNSYSYQDPRYVLTTGTATPLSPAWPPWDPKTWDPYFFDALDTQEACRAWSFKNSNCVMPKAVYKIYAEGTWLTAESDWPDYFDPLERDPRERCRTKLLAPGSPVPACGDPAADPVYLSPPRRLVAVVSGDDITLEWTPPAIPAGKPPLSGYYLYARPLSTSSVPTFLTPMPFAKVGPGERVATLGGLRSGTYDFSIAAVDTAGRVSTIGQGSQTCSLSGQACDSNGACPTKTCATSNRDCTTNACPGYCSITGSTCSGASPCASFCSDSHTTPCVPSGWRQTAVANLSNIPSQVVDLNSGSLFVQPFTKPIIAGDALIAIFKLTGTNPPPVDTITQTGAVWQEIPEVRTPIAWDGMLMQVFYALNVSSSVGSTLTLSSGGVLSGYMQVYEYHGILSAEAVDLKVEAGATGTAYLGPYGPTSSAYELWLVTIGRSTGWTPSPTNGFRKVPDNPGSGLHAFEKLATEQGLVEMADQWITNTKYVAAVVTFHMWSGPPECSAGATCVQQSCLSDTCLSETCQEAEGRLCENDPFVACMRASDCPKYVQGHCSQTTGQSCVTNNSLSCPGSETCVPGDSCRSYQDHVTVTGGTGSDLNTLIWTVNDGVFQKGRSGVKLSWYNAWPFRIYRSTDPDGPYCALLKTSEQPANPPLPSGIQVCSSDVPGRTIDNNVVSTVGSDRKVYWDVTVGPGKDYYYRRTKIIWGAETSLASAPQVSARVLPYEPKRLPPPQGFKAWAPANGTTDMQGIYLKWCPEPTSGEPDWPTLTEYDVYRTVREGMASGGPYTKIARLSPACLASVNRCSVSGTDCTAAACSVGETCRPQGNRCEITRANDCLDNQNSPSACDIIQPEPTCSNESGATAKPCAIVDLTFCCWPRDKDSYNFQVAYDYHYVVTAMGQTGAEVKESMPSFENTGSLNYCADDSLLNCNFTTCSSTRTCAWRRDVDGDGDYLVCGDENASLRMPVDPADREAALEQLMELPVAEMMAPHRTIGQGGFTYSPPSRLVFYHLDHLGSPRVITDSSGAVVSTHHYLPFGDERPAPTDPTLNTRAFTGHERDRETGLDYMLARYYSSSLGRFMSVDPKGYHSRTEATRAAFLRQPQNWNGYTYALNNPMKFVDPDGEEIVNKATDATTKSTVNRALGASPRVQALHANKNVVITVTTGETLTEAGKDGGETFFKKIGGKIYMTIVIDPEKAGSEERIEHITLVELGKAEQIAKEPEKVAWEVNENNPKQDIHARQKEGEEFAADVKAAMRKADEEKERQEKEKQK